MSILRPEYQDAKIKTRARDYIIDGTKYRRVSTILGVINKPALVGWAKRITLEEVDRILRDEDTHDGLATLFADPTDVSDAYTGWVDRVIENAKLASDHKRDEAANKGTSIHEEIQSVLTDSEDIALSPQAYHAVQYLQDNGITLEATELTVWDSTNRIAGTCDWVGPQ